ncbi:cytotoxic T-lymphocyte protein 4 isoform X1 [Alosa sapidissima]|uniref:cytotoxic T-lymphocyte protein 4 isoform X1 n=1 Tax=Alosa sapidissima TaxID=34773 RepID=UPI001C09D95A|nr:cytotoxic T-lymphocyte protein 4 isoform X1 [Alosa sapidissima]
MYNSLIIASLVYLATPAVNGLRIVQPYRVVATDDQATVECRYASPPRYQPLELHVTLLKGLYGAVSICGGYVNSTIGSMQTQGTKACKVTLSERGVNVSVAGMKEDDTDLYRCVVKVLYPPPYLERFGNGTLVYVPEYSVTEPNKYQTPEMDLNQGLTELMPTQQERQKGTQKEMQGLGVTWVELPLPLVMAIGILIVCAMICQVNGIRHARRHGRSTQPLTPRVIPKII